MQHQGWRWALGLTYIVAVAVIWIAASYIVQSVVGGGVSPFFITYICSSLFLIYIPVIEMIHCWEDSAGRLWFWRSGTYTHEHRFGRLEEIDLLGDSSHSTRRDICHSAELVNLEPAQNGAVSELEDIERVSDDQTSGQNFSEQLDSKGRWTRSRVAKLSLLISPFWFLAQLTFNISLKYTTVTSNTILSSTSSLFTFFVSVIFMGEKFTCVKLASVVLCMAGTIIVSLSDSKAAMNAVASNPILGDILSLISAIFYSIYITLIRQKLPNEEKGEGDFSMAQFLGFVGLFNLLIFLPVALALNFMGHEPFHEFSSKQFGLIIGKGLLDNVLSDYLWAKAVLLTSPTATTAGLSIQVPLAALVDTFTGHPPRPMVYVGAAAVMVGFVGINIPSDLCLPKPAFQEPGAEIVSMAVSRSDLSPVSADATANSL